MTSGHNKIRPTLLQRPCHFNIVMVVCIIILLLSGSCKKSDIKIDKVDPKKQQIINSLDSIYLYAKQIYLWNTSLPPFEQFNPNGFYQSTSDEITSYRKEIYELSRFALNPSTNKPYELNIKTPLIPKYSTIVETRAAGSTGSNSITGNQKSAYAFGLSLYQDDSEIRILSADLNSPAGLSGLKRGDRIIAINDQAIDYADVFSTLWKNAIQNSFVKITIVDHTGKTRQVRLNNSFYEPNPVLKHSIISVDQKKIGFIAYNSFTEENNSARFLDPVFSKFSQEGISELIIDLRYNSGGFQNTAIYFANQISPLRLSGSVMFTEHYNEGMQKGRADILRNQLIKGGNNEPIYIDGRPATLYDIDYSIAANTVMFKKAGKMNNVSKVYFIVSDQTASASELLINVLKPHMEVKLIGVSISGQSQVQTYGKPVGFFDIDINKHKLLIAMYCNKNADDEGDYYDGFPADFVTSDDPTSDFGSLDDPAVKIILSAYHQAIRKLSKAPFQYTKHLNGRYIFNSGRLEGTIKNMRDLSLRK